ncbi:hypothetical protein [Saccharothrix hoggarensis]|uniref:Uncharacterized protein n=1 Tax=Saccharothrix hoggarensis TaxID=913853 RepID=A0ABW3R6Q2_9PSEU
MGTVLKAFRPPWNSVGTGVIIGGVLGVLLAVGLVVVVLVALRQWSQGY